MRKQRFPSPLYALLPQPRPGEREIRYHPPRDHTANHPKMEASHHV